MAKAVIQLKNGATVSIEGTQNEVAEILARFENTRVVSEIKQHVKVERAEKKGNKKRATATELIVELKEEGFFEKPRTFGEVTHALESRGYLYPGTTLSGVMLGLVQKKLLRRKKHEGKWVYGK